MEYCSCHEGSSGEAVGGGAGRVPDGVQQGPRQGRDVAHQQKPSGDPVQHDLAVFTGIGGDHRQSAGTGFDQRSRQRFVDRCRHHTVEGGQDLGDILAAAQ